MKIDLLEIFEYNQHFVAMMNIINFAKLINKEGQFEKHHIIPRCWYKKNNLAVDNSENNIVNLTIEEHRKVHKLAALCAKEIIKNEMICAANIMNRENIGVYYFTDETKLKISKACTGEKNGFYGKHHTEEFRKTKSDLMKKKLKSKRQQVFYNHYKIYPADNRELYCKEIYCFKKYGKYTWEMKEYPPRKNVSDNTRIKLSGSASKPRTQFGKKYIEHYGHEAMKNHTMYQREQRFYKKYGKCSWE